MTNNKKDMSKEKQFHRVNRTSKDLVPKELLVTMAINPDFDISAYEKAKKGQKILDSSRIRRREAIFEEFNDLLRRRAKTGEEIQKGREERIKNKNHFNVPAPCAKGIKEDSRRE